MTMRNGKKIAFLFVAVVALAGCGCGKKDVEEVVVTEEVKPEVIPYEKPENASPITGVACDNFNKRAFGVMYSGDTDAHKYYSGISQADLVVEMPHRPSHGQTRALGVFQCNTPTQVGPMRSGRTDHISFAGAMDAVFVPWGGSSVGKNLLKKRVIDHIDCNGEIAPSGSGTPACFLDRSIRLTSANPAFANVAELVKIADQQGYRKESNFAGFKHQGEVAPEDRPSNGRITVGFPKPFRVHYHYNPETNSYERDFNGQPEFDFQTKERIAPKNIVVIPAKKTPFYSEEDYVGKGLQDPWDGSTEAQKKNDNAGYPNMALGDPWFDTKFEGEAYFFMNGKEIIGTWKREKGIDNPFQFFDAEGAEIHFVPGQIWVAITEPGQTVKWKVEDGE